LNCDTLILHHTVIGFHFATPDPNISLTKGPLNNPLIKMRQLPAQKPVKTTAVIFGHYS
jgi:hypothetical protein